MRQRLGFCGIAIITCALVSGAHAQQAAAPAGSSRGRLRNSVGIELLGRAALYSFEYQRMMTPSFGLDVGLGVLGGSSDTGEDATVFFVPAGAKFYLIPRDGSLFVTGGAVLVSGFLSSGPFSENASDFYGFGGLGFEYRAAGGFLFRGSAYALFGDGGYFIWPGITVGFAF